jgi:hypothetical protein
MDGYPLTNDSGAIASGASATAVKAKITVRRSPHAVP